MSLECIWICAADIISRWQFMDKKNISRIKVKCLNSVFLGFNQVVQDSKGKADDALTRVPEIEALIEEAESRTQEASDALSGAEKDANDALRIAEQAESNAQDASEVSSIYDMSSADDLLQTVWTQTRTDRMSVLTWIQSVWHSDGTVKPVKSGHSKIDKTKILMAKGSLMKVQSIAECSPWSILQYFWPALSDNLSWKPILVFFLSGCLRQVYCIPERIFSKKLILKNISRRQRNMKKILSMQTVKKKIHSNFYWFTLFAVNEEQFHAIWSVEGSVWRHLVVWGNNFMQLTGQRKSFTLQKFMSRNLSPDFKMCNDNYRGKVEIIRDEYFNRINKWVNSAKSLVNWTFPACCFCCLHFKNPYINP